MRYLIIMIVSLSASIPVPVATELATRPLQPWQLEDVHNLFYA